MVPPAATPDATLALSLPALFREGGWVMYPLLALSLIGAALVVERAIFWAGLARRGREAALARAGDALRRGDLDGAARFVEADASVYGRCVDHLVRAMRDGPIGEGAASEAVERVRTPVERFATSLSTIITAAPILGILGTVLGIIQSFAVLGLADAPSGAGVDLAAVAAGIAQALYTTAFGLIISIGVLLPYAVFRARADRCLSRLDVLGAGAIEGSQRAHVGPGVERGVASSRVVGSGSA